MRAVRMVAGQAPLAGLANKSGAVVGKHRVEIVPHGAEVDASTDLRPKNAPPKLVIPARYNRNSELTFEVPTGGTEKADFPLTSP